MKLNITKPCKNVLVIQAIPGHLYDYRGETIFCFRPCNTQGEQKVQFVRLTNLSTSYHTPQPAGLILQDNEELEDLGEAIISN